MNRPELFKKCLELGGIKAHKEKVAKLAKIRKMKLKKLLKKVNELEKEAKFIEENKCRKCLNQQRIQRKIDEEAHNQRLLAHAMGDLICEYCKHANLAPDGDDTVCVLCGSVQYPGVDASKKINS